VALEVLRRIRAAVDKDKEPGGPGVIIMVKMNGSDGMPEGLDIEESCTIDTAFAACGVDIIGVSVSGGLVHENGLFMLRGNVPLSNMIKATTDTCKRVALMIFGPIVIPRIDFNELYFIDAGKCILQAVNTGR